MRLQLPITTVIKEHTKAHSFDSCLYTERLILESNRQLSYLLKFRQLYPYILALPFVAVFVLPFHPFP